MKRPSFVGEAVVPAATHVATPALDRGEPPLPDAFTWRGEALCVATVRRSWRSTTMDRGDAYLARHWFELDLIDGRSAVVYFDRKAKRGAARWWLYTLDLGEQRLEL